MTDNPGAIERLEPSFRVVSKAAFFAVIGPLNVHPRVLDHTLRQPGIVSIWEDRNRKAVGRSTSFSGGLTRFELSAING